MIKDRPKYLLADPVYKHLPKAPYIVDYTSVPELVRATIGLLDGIEPITLSHSLAVGGNLQIPPTEEEWAYHEKRGTKFQWINVVASVVPVRQGTDGFVVTPFALTLIPASKRGKVEEFEARKVSRHDMYNYLNRAGPFYTGFDPFTGEWTAHFLGAHDYFNRERIAGFLDELGIVIGQFFLALDFDRKEVLSPNVGVPREVFRQYVRHRTKKLFSAFKKIGARRIWGVDSPIELFLLQALAKRGYHPQLQIIILPDGSTFASQFDLYADLEFRYAMNSITEADMFFPNERVLVFCDGRAFHRKKSRDESINVRLEELGFTVVRLSGAEIVNDTATAVERVISTVEEARAKLPAVSHG